MHSTVTYLSSMQPDKAGLVEEDVKSKGGIWVKRKVFRLTCFANE